LEAMRDFPRSGLNQYLVTSINPLKQFSGFFDGHIDVSRFCQRSGIPCLPYV